MKFVYSIWIFLFLSIHSLSAVDKVTKSNMVSMSTSSPLIVITSLGCDMGQGYVDSINSSLEDLKGVKVVWADINESYSIFKSDKPIEIGNLLLVKDGKILDTSKDADSEASIITGNLAKLWVFNSLKKNKIQFTMSEPEPDFLDPLPDTSTPDINNGFKAHFPLTSDMKNQLGEEGARFVPGLRNKIVNGAYYMDGEYGYDKSFKFYNEGSIDLPGEVTSGFSVSLNVKPEERKDNEKFLLFSVGYRMLDFYRNSKTGKLVVKSSVSCQDCGKNKKSLWLQGKYNYPNITVDLNKWHNFAVAVDFANNRALIYMNGKRLSDINLGKDFGKIYLGKDKYSYYRSRVLALDMAGNGSVLKGYAKDMIYYDRVLSGKELLAVQKKYSTTAIPVTEDPKPVLANQENLNKELLNAAYTGDANTVSTSIESGAEINTKYNGWTPLMIASFYGFEEVVKVLIEKNADPLIEISGWNAQRFAKKKNYESIVTLLENYSNTSRFFAQRKFILKNTRADLTPPKFK